MILYWNALVCGLKQFANHYYEKSVFGIQSYMQIYYLKQHRHISGYYVTVYLVCSLITVELWNMHIFSSTAFAMFTA